MVEDKEVYDSIWLRIVQNGEMGLAILFIIPGFATGTGVGSIRCAWDSYKNQTTPVP